MTVDSSATPRAAQALVESRGADTTPGHTTFIKGGFPLPTLNQIRFFGAIFSMWIIRIERQYWSGGPTAADCALIKEIERRDVSENLSLVDGLGRTHQLRILGPAGRGLRIAVEDLSVKRGVQLQSSGIDLTGCRPQELVVDFGETIELNT